MNTSPALKPVSLSKYKYTVESEYGEEPCILAVTYYLIVPPNRSCRDSDVDYYGYREIEFEVLHMNGDPWPEADEEVASNKALRKFFMDEITGEEW
jgi:hypothetical protein